jgi:hypothetical protein
VIISKDILKLIKRDAPKVPVFAMANKQDKPTAMKSEVVQKILGIPTYPMVAIDEERRDEMLRILMTAASQYVGVALPDLPASELLKFTDAATEDAIAEVEAEVEEEEVEEEDEDYETVIEEVYVDEDGKVLEDLEDYEIVDEEVEEIEVIEEEEVEEEPEEELVVEEEIEEEEIIEEVSEEPEPVEVEAPEEFEVPTIEEEEEEEVVDVDVEVEVVAPEPEVLGPEPSYFDEGPELVVKENSEAIQLAKDIIFEALEADDIIVAEIDQVSAEEIDTALEAIGSSEAIPIDDETDDADKIDEESLMELESILGPLDRSVGGLGDVETDGEDDSHLPINGETLAELDRLFDAPKGEEKND